VDKRTIKAGLNVDFLEALRISEVMYSMGA
jgi:hypothetical protein